MDLVETLRRYLDEDVGFGDITTESLIGRIPAKAWITCGERCVVAGLQEASVLFRLLDCTADALVHDGDMADAETCVMVIGGDAHCILRAERVALNIMSRMSGIATMTRSLIERCRKVNPDVSIAATRKTTPGFRYFEKRAVIVGGGDPHRFGLDDAILIKDNHLVLVGCVEEAVRRAKISHFTKKVEIEVENADDAMRAAEAGADIIMLDNFSPEDARAVYEVLKKRYPHLLIEVSGGITPENAPEYANCADVISLGALTHSYRSIDFSLEIRQ